ncbi:MAG: hypothetical protein ABS37_00370 [Acidovorax sp. SCN 65-108]|nr:MAG: hypothetical protein ABS37_00370 [Acidovorax sp. SCN 65-108]OJV73523.1 MAG: hypothetical protein BGO35_13110 [Burkholderiales bacterium 64-34]
MNIYIDTEFNDFGGELISLAMVDENGREFYAVLNCQNPTPWVAENVIPVLGQRFASLRMLQTRMEAWLAEYDSVHLIANWPEDIAHFCRALITGPGMRMDTPPLTLEVRRDLSSEASAIPHNALEDARAIWRAAQKTTTEKGRP